MRRPLTWVILGWNALMAVWLVTGTLSAANDTNTSCVGEFADSCRSGAAIGMGIGIFLILGVAAFGDVILGVVWLVTRRQPKAPMQTGWYPDPAGRYWRRFWDGSRWTAYVAASHGEESIDPYGAPPTISV